MNVDKIRQDFPLLQKKDAPLYFDSSCVSLKPKQVVEAMDKYYFEFPACGGRSAHKLGDKVTDAVEESRKIVARFINAKKPEEVIFTRNTTEAINLLANSLDLKEGTVLTTDKEHNSNLLPWLKLAKKGIIRHKIIPTKADNTFDLAALEKLLKEGKVKLVALNHISNLDGVENPVKDIAKMVHSHKALLLVDGAQSAGHREIDVRNLDCDFFCFSGHKMLGPSGIGALYGKMELLEKLDQFLVGGDTVKDTRYDGYEMEDIPHRFEAGLQNYAGIIGFAAACQYLSKIGLKDIQKHSLALNAILTEGLKKLPLTVIGPQDPKQRNGVLSFYSKKMDSHDIALLLNENSIYVRSGAFCVHSWFNGKKLKGAVRLSCHVYNTEEECRKVVEFMNRNLGKLL